MCKKLTAIFIYLLYSTIINLPLPIFSLYYSYSSAPQSCIYQLPSSNNIDINLHIWLSIYGYSNIFYLIALSAAAIMVGATSQTGICLLSSSLLLIFYNTLFQVTLSIIGSIIFFEEIMYSCTKSQDTSFNAFMHALLISSYIIAPFNILIAIIFRKRNKSQKQKYQQQKDQQSQQQNVDDVKQGQS